MLAKDIFPVLSTRHVLSEPTANILRTCRTYDIMPQTNRGWSHDRKKGSSRAEISLFSKTLLLRTGTGFLICSYSTKTEVKHRTWSWPVSSLHRFITFNLEVLTNPSSLECTATHVSLDISVRLLFPETTSSVVSGLILQKPSIIVS